jgi:hypothetical protein
MDLADDQDGHETERQNSRDDALEAKVRQVPWRKELGVPDRIGSR